MTFKHGNVSLADMPAFAQEKGRQPGWDGGLVTFGSRDYSETLSI